MTAGQQQGGVSHASTSSTKPTQLGGQTTTIGTATSGQRTTLGTSYPSTQSTGHTSTTLGQSTTLGSRATTGNVISSTGTSAARSVTQTPGQTTTVSGTSYTSGQPTRTVLGTTGTTSQTISGQTGSYTSTTPATYTSTSAGGYTSANQGTRVISGTTTTGTTQYTPSSNIRLPTTTYSGPSTTSATVVSGPSVTYNRPSQTSRPLTTYTSGTTTTTGTVLRPSQQGLSTITGHITTQPATTSYGQTYTTSASRPLTTVGSTATPVTHYATHATTSYQPATVQMTGATRTSATLATPTTVTGATTVYRHTEVQPSVHLPTTTRVSEDYNAFSSLGRTQTAPVVHAAYTAELDEDDDEALEDRRFTEDTARTLGRILFGRYDENRSGFLNSYETSALITDFYCSLNIDHPSNRREGFDFMVANDINNDGEFSVKDFEDIFVHHLSTGSNTTGYRLFTDKKVAAVKAEFGGRGGHHVAAVEQVQTQQTTTATTTQQAVQGGAQADVSFVQRVAPGIGKVAVNAWEQHQQTILTQIREKGITEGQERGLKDAALMAAHLQQPGVAGTYEEGFALGLQHGVQDGYRRAEETQGASDILFNQWQWQPEIIRSAANVIEHQAVLPPMDHWHYQQAILTGANQILSLQEQRMLEAIQGQVDGAQVVEVVQYSAASPQDEAILIQSTPYQLGESYAVEVNYEQNAPAVTSHFESQVVFEQEGAICPVGDYQEYEQS